ncbi:MAG: hypothetical protein IJL78_09730 [Lachnospiraceae bacterium]|nr:hypothetical protein [Lachnospiraceae bacterium]
MAKKIMFPQEEWAFDLYAAIEKRERMLNALIKELSERVNAAPAGMLHSKRHGKGFQYYRRMRADDTNGVYLAKKDMKLIRELAQKEYDAQLLSEIMTEHGLLLEYLHRVERDSMRRSIDLVRPGLQPLVRPVIQTDEEFVREWLSFEYTGKSFPPDAAPLFTKKNEQVRSKSEILIANTLADLGIPYRYECPLQLPNRLIYPDFTALNVRLRKVVYIEHFGMMLDPDYCEHALNKISSYEEAGIFPGRDLLFLHETPLRPLDLRLTTTLFKSFLL